MPVISSVLNSPSPWHVTGLALLPPQAAPPPCSSHSLVCQASSVPLAAASEIIVVSSCARLSSPFDCSTSWPRNCCPASCTKFETTTAEACCTAAGAAGGERTGVPSGMNPGKPLSVISATLKNLSGKARRDAVSICCHPVASFPCVYPALIHAWRLPFRQGNWAIALGGCAGRRNSSVKVLMPQHRHRGIPALRLQMRRKLLEE